jgi:NAD(P)-dependent dehydrogenase (short-subunit alcohol dehydrogenase family)
MAQTILLTGAAGGFGRLIAHSLIAKEHRVLATMRAVEGRNRDAAKELEAKGATVLEMDVTDDASVATCIEKALQQAGQLDVVINNAGVGVLGLQETFTAQDLQRLFEINVIGVHRVNRAVLPHMRKNKQGLLVHISSLLGRITIPFYGPYNASKWALEALTENYSMELVSFGIDVCLVEPGGYPTSFMDHLVRPSDTGRAASYGDMASAPEQFLAGFEQALASNPAQNPQNVADAVTSLIATPAGQRPFRTIVDAMGMGQAVEGYNQQLAQITRTIYGNFGIDGMLARRN